jgi:hypothetical protein
VIGFAIDSRGKVPGKTCEKRRNNNNNNPISSCERPSVISNPEIVCRKLYVFDNNVQCHPVHINVVPDDLESLKSTEKEKNIFGTTSRVFISRSASFFPVVENTICLMIC